MSHQDRIYRQGGIQAQRNSTIEVVSTSSDLFIYDIPFFTMPNAGKIIQKELFTTCAKHKALQHMFTQLLKQKLYNTLHNYTTRVTIIPNFSKLYATLHKSTQLSQTSQHVYKTFQNFTKLLQNVS